MVIGWLSSHVLSVVKELAVTDIVHTAHKVSSISCCNQRKHIMNEKSAQRRKHCARAGCSKVRTPPTRHTHKQDRLQYTAPLASTRCKNDTKKERKLQMQYLVGQITFTGYRWKTQNTIEYVLEMLSLRYRYWQQ